MKKFGVYASTAVGATAVSMTFFGSGIAAADTVLVYLNCNAAVATNKDPGNSAGSPEGRAAIAAAQNQKESGGSGS